MWFLRVQLGLSCLVFLFFLTNVVMYLVVNSGIVFEARLGSVEFTLSIVCMAALIANSGPCIATVKTIMNKHDITMYPFLSHEAIMMQILERTCTDESDRYYGLLGIFEPDQLKMEMPNRNRKLEHVYRSLFVELLGWTRSLDILLLVYPFNTFDFPSWVIDWENTEGYHWIICRYFFVRPSRFLKAAKFDKFKGATAESKSLWEMPNE